MFCARLLLKRDILSVGKWSPLCFGLANNDLPLVLVLDVYCFMLCVCYGYVVDIFWSQFPFRSTYIRRMGPTVYLLFFFLACGGWFFFVIISIDYHGSGWLMSWLQDDVEDMPCISPNILNLVCITITSLLNIITCITHTWHVYVLTSPQGESLLPSFLLVRIYYRWKCEGHHTERNRIQEVSVAELKNPNLIFQTCALTFNIITVTCSFRILLWHFVHPPSRMIHFVGI